MHDFLLSPRDFLLGAFVALVGLIGGCLSIAFWLVVGAIMLFWLIQLLWGPLSEWLWALLVT